MLYWCCGCSGLYYIAVAGSPYACQTCVTLDTKKRMQILLSLGIEHTVILKFCIIFGANYLSTFLFTAVNTHYQQNGPYK